MTVTEAYAPYFAAVLIAVAAFCAYGFYQVREMEKKKRFYAFAQSEIDEGLLAAHRVLLYDATPTAVRRALLVMLKTLAIQDLGSAFMRKFSTSMSELDENLDHKNSLTEAMEELRAQNAQIAADAHKALMSITLLAIPLKHADRVDVSEVKVFEYVSKGATNPDSIFDRVGKTANRFNKDDFNGTGVAMPC